MKHLNSVDAAFLHLESDEMPLHVGGLNVCTLPEGYQGDYFRDVQAHIGGRVHLAPVLYRRLVFMPLDFANPVWIEDDDEVDLDRHVFRDVLPEPGTTAQLEECVGLLHGWRLDRSKPLWEIHVIEGLETGQVAIYSKIHHAGLDGAAAAALASTVFDLTPVSRTYEIPPPDDRPKRQPNVVELAAAALTNIAAQSAKLVRLVPDAARAVASIALPSERAPDEKASPESAPKGSRFAPKTPLNVTVSHERAFAGLALSLGETKTIAKHFGVTINDVVLAVCSGALRAYLAGRGDLPARSLVGLMPISLRDRDDREQNNQFTVALANLATDVADPVERVRAIHASASKAKGVTKRLKTAIPLDLPSLGMPWWMGGIAFLVERAKLADTLPPLANLLISNVPGSQVPLYVAGARVETDYPLSVLYHGMALNITVKSYNGSLDVGLTACRRAVPSAHEIADHLRAAFDELKALATPEEAAPPKPRAKAKRKAAAASTPSPDAGTPRRARRKTARASEDAIDADSH